MRRLALFDFDHTLYESDSLIDFTKHVKGNRLYSGMLLLLPELISMKLGWLSNHKMKERYFTLFFKGMQESRMQEFGKTFASRIANGISPPLLRSLEQHLEDKDTVIIVTASCREWIEPWSRQYGISVIGTRLETKDGIITGSICGLNCSGPEKVERIRAVLDLGSYDRIFVYGKGEGDKEMLNLRR